MAGLKVREKAANVGVVQDFCTVVYSKMHIKKHNAHVWNNS